MTTLYIFNYSSLSDVRIRSYLNDFIGYLKDNDIQEQFIIEFCDESIKSIFQDYISSSRNQVLIGNLDFLIQLNDYLYEKSNFRNIKYHKFVFIGEEILTRNYWGEANDWIAVVKKVEEKVVWHEVAHLLGAIDHYSEKSHQVLDICKDHERCIMTYGILNGIICSKSIDEISNYLMQKDCIDG